MATFWTWGLRNPFYLLGALLLAAGATGVLDWGLSLMAFSTAAIIASTANHLAQRSRERREVKAALAEAQVIQVEGRKRRAGYQEYLEQNDVPVEKAA